MITIAILILIVAKALPGLNTHISSTHVTRITSIVFLFAGALSLNSLNLESIGKGIGIYSGFFQVTTITQLIEIFLFMIGGGILIAWPQIKYKLYFSPLRSNHPPAPAKQEISKGQEVKYLGKADSSVGSVGSVGTVGTVVTEGTVGKGNTSLPTQSCLSPQEAQLLFLRRGESPKNPSSASVTSAAPLEQVAPGEPVGETGLSPGSDKSPCCEAAEGQSKLENLTLILTDKHSTDYSIVVIFSSLGSSLLISSYDLISVYLSIELQSFGLYVLSTLYREKESSTSAGLKYFLLGGLSSCIILLGTGIIYSYTGTTNLESLYCINSVIDHNLHFVIQGFSLGFALIFIGFLFKIAAAPLHNWSPDVYDGTPTIVTTWLTIIPKIAILFILLELQVKLAPWGLASLGTPIEYLNFSNFSSPLDSNFDKPLGSYLADPLTSLRAVTEVMGGEAIGNAVLKTNIITILRSGYLLKTLLLISATLSLIIGSLLGLAQIRIKRLLAYSTISHLGFILLALAVNTEQSIDSFIFYILQYTITNLNIFLVILGLTYCLSINKSIHSSFSVYSLPSFPAFCSPTNGGAVEVDHLLLPLLRRSRIASKDQAKANAPATPATPATPSEEEEGVATAQSLTKSIWIDGSEAGVGKEAANLTTEGLKLNKEISLISDLKGLFFSNPLLSLSLAVSLFSMAGIPPLIGFFSKQLVLYSALINGYYFISFLAIIVSVISCSYYLQIIKVLLTPIRRSASSSEDTRLSIRQLGEQPFTPLNTAPAFHSSNASVGTCFSQLWGEEIRGVLLRSNTRKKNEIILTNTHSYLISTLTFTILLFFIKPSLILNSTQLLSLSLFYI